MVHEPCASRGDCYHVRGGQNGSHEAKVRAGQVGGRIGGRISGRRNVESGHLARIREKGLATLMANPEILRAAGRKRIALYGNPRTPEGSSKGGRNQPREVKIRNGRIAGRKNVESGELERARMVKTSPSKEEIKRLHIPLAPLGFEFNQHLKIDSGSSIEVDAVKGKIVAFYDGTYWHSLSEVVKRDRRDTERLQAASYTVFRFFGRAPTSEELSTL